MYLASRFKLLSRFLVPVEWQWKKLPLRHWTNQYSFLSSWHSVYGAVIVGIRNTEQKGFCCVSAKWNDVFTSWFGGQFSFEASEGHDGNSHTEIAMKKKRFREVQSLICQLCLQLLPVYARISVLAEESEKSVWKGLCWLQVFVAFGGASCKSRQIWLQWKGVMGQLQPNCYPEGILEALAGSHEMHLPGEDCIANRPCPSLSVNSFGGRLAPEHLKMFMVKLQWFLPSLRWGWGLHCVHWLISHIRLFQKVSL